uniref:Secreted protein n=1 Tax=Steinernema glaseri TaxID=37863 RepID=A0A1I8AFL1_9BILA
MRSGSRRRVAAVFSLAVPPRCRTIVRIHLCCRQGYYCTGGSGADELNSSCGTGAVIDVLTVLALFLYILPVFVDRRAGVVPQAEVPRISGLRLCAVWRWCLVHDNDSKDTRTRGLSLGRTHNTAWLAMTLLTFCDPYHRASGDLVELPFGCQATELSSHVANGAIIKRIRSNEARSSRD